MSAAIGTEVAFGKTAGSTKADFSWERSDTCVRLVLCLLESLAWLTGTATIGNVEEGALRGSGTALGWGESITFGGAVGSTGWPFGVTY